MLKTTRLLRQLNHSPYLKQSLQYRSQNYLWGFGKKKKQEPETPVEQQQQLNESQNLTENIHNNQETIAQVQQQQVQQEVIQQPEIVLDNVEKTGSVTDQVIQNSSGFQFKIDTPSYYSNSYISEMDLGNVGSSMATLNQYQHIDVLSKFSHLSPGYLYDCLDVATRDLLFWIAEPQGLGLGLGLSIAICSLGIKTIFMPLMVGTQINAQKMKLIEPEMKNFQNQVQALQRRQDFQGVKAAQKQNSELRKRYGVKNWITVLGLGQIPFLITWFLSLRYVCSLPDKFPALKTEGILWFQDLSEADPYYILPLLNATLSYFNISMNPNLSSTTGGNVFSKYMKYLKYAPFATLPIVAFFPSGLNIYWTLTAATHLSVTMFVRNAYIRQKIFRIPEYLPGSILEKLNQKHTQKVIKTTIVDQNDSKKQMAEQIAMSLAGKKLTDAQKANSSMAQKIQQQQTQKVAASTTTTSAAAGGVQVSANKPKKPTSAAKPASTTGGGVQVFANRPKKAKKK